MFSGIQFKCCYSYARSLAHVETFFSVFQHAARTYLQFCLGCSATDDTGMAGCIRWLLLEDAEHPAPARTTKIPRYQFNREPPFLCKPMCAAAHIARALARPLRVISPTTIFLV